MKTEFFLGANSGNGFYSLYDDFCNDDGDFLYLIKAGPGGGKSSFMRKIGAFAEGKGYDVEYVLCSGDPNSLDGVYIPRLKLGFADATAPHVMEAEVFGHSGNYVNLGQFCRTADNDNVPRLNRAYKAQYERAYTMLKAAATIKDASFSKTASEAIIEKINKKAYSTAHKHFVRVKLSDDLPKIKRRFIRGLSCCGEYILKDTIHSLCKLIYSVDDKFGLADIYLKRLRSEAMKRGEKIIECPSPLLPHRLDGLIFPTRQVGFFSSEVLHGDDATGHVRLDALLSGADNKSKRALIRTDTKLYNSIMAEAYSSLKNAKELHDELESAYKPYIDFGALSDFSEGFLTLIK